MHRCFLFPVALSVQLVVCFLCAVAAFPSVGRQASFAPSSSSDSEEELTGPAGLDLQNLQYRPKLLTLLQLGFLSSKLDPRSSETGSSSSEVDSDEVESDLGQLDTRARSGPAAAIVSGEETPKRRFSSSSSSATTRVMHKKMGGLDRGEGPPRLSIVNPLDVLRQKMMLELLRARNQSTQRIVEENAKVMESLGKRNVRDFSSVVRPNHQRLSQMLSSLVSSTV